MRARIALLAVRGEHTGPWLLMHEGETSLRIKGLGPHDSLWLEHADGRREKFEANGTFGHPLPKRFRFSKRPGPSALPTTVEVLAP